MRGTDRTNEAIVSLVQEAQAGNDIAFGELIGLYRAKAYRWARDVVKDPYLAEDIVQDAFLRAYLRKESLLGADHFMAWLYRIVRNEALMKARRGGYYRKERPVDAGHESFLQAIGDPESEPDREAARIESENMLRRLLDGLNTRERAVMEAHLFSRLSAGEIAVRLLLTPANVYQLLSRSRQKLQKARYGLLLQDYLDAVTRAGVAGKRHIPLPFQYFGEVWDTAILGALLIMKNTHGNEYTLPRLMGMTGQAFRLTLHRDRLDASSPFAFHWGRAYSEGFANIGYQAEYRWSADRPCTPETFLETVAWVRRAIDEGSPIIGWNLRNPLFGLITGYHDQAQKFEIAGMWEHRQAAYEDFVRKELFVMRIAPGRPREEEEMFFSAIKRMGDHAFGTEEAIEGTVQGLEAYDVWIRLLREGACENFGMCFAVAYTGDARRNAVLFLQECLDSNMPLYKRPGIRLALETALRHFREVHSALWKLRALYPYPRGVQAPSGSESERQAILLLEKARLEEEEGWKALRFIAR
ncbi:RNA polymerase sigma factor [Cohnella faecalis]|uniref:RNA polymerase sigma factor n=1 Tax=Cohnella faecalis TaxID=2315694 RepID=A0A398CGF3_9BACL|nr:sigma-70 family RNA polymerase sigma factor [Cohnella faecalis]RIE01813.1 sigma-70 family RNA polymerase sigma factor [Cohnella faecalis]